MAENRNLSEHILNFRSFALIHTHACHNGICQPAAEIRLSPFQTGLLSGWGLFSTLRIYQGVPFALEDHLERLEQDARILRMDISEWRPRVEDIFRELIAANAAREAMARLYFIRNRGGLLDFPGQRPTDLLLFTADLKNWGASARLKLLPHGRDSRAPLAGTKTLTWAHNLVMLETAAAEGYDDCLLLNERGELAECTSANIFIVRQGALLTPPLDSGALPGVSRKRLLQLAGKAGVTVRETALRPEDLDTADEVFISSSTRELQRVSQIDDKPLAGAGPGLPRLQKLLTADIEAYTRLHQNHPS